MERWREGDEGQSRSPLALPAHNDPRIKASLLYMEQNMDAKVRVEQIAQHVGISRRQLERLFHSSGCSMRRLASLRAPRSLGSA